MEYVWLEIAKMIYDQAYEGPYICNLADTLYRIDRITLKQWESVMIAVNEERDKQGTPDVLWSDLELRYLNAPGRVNRIRFCTKQIRRLRGGA
jgi:hypothetical protein